MNMLFLMNKTKDQISWVSSHDLYCENKMYKRKRSICNCESNKTDTLTVAVLIIWLGWNNLTTN